MSAQRSLAVHLLPHLFEPAQVVGGAAVIIDILRASSTITTALDNGALNVVPCGSVEDAFQLRAAFGADRVLLGGERGGIRIDGFDLGNSPFEYPREIVQGKVVVFTTTNGTKALLRASQAEEVYIGCFLNLSAVCQRLMASTRPVHLVCAGTDGQVTGEDVLFAGALCDLLVRESESSGRFEFQLTDSAVIARAAWSGAVVIEDSQPVRSGTEQLSVAMSQTHGGRNLRHLGYNRDIAYCSAIDSLSCVAHRSNASDGKLVLL